MDPVEIRRRNYIAPGAMPYNTTAGWTVGAAAGGPTTRATSPGSPTAAWNSRLERLFLQERKLQKKNGKLRGRALIYYLEDSGVFNERMELRFDPSGMVTIVAGTHNHGQGHATTYAQLVSEWLGVAVRERPPRAGRYRRGVVRPRHLRLAQRNARRLGAPGRRRRHHREGEADRRAICSKLREDIEFKEGKFTVVGTDRSIPLAEVAKGRYRPVGPTTQFGIGLDASGASAAPPTFPNGCHACEVEVDPETGVVEIDRYAVVDDVGRVINPMICHGQIEGALAQGIGQALMENVAFDRASGQMLSASFADYAMPRAADLPPHYELDFIDVPAKTNPLGVKGIGEAGCVGAPPAVMNAILDALRPARGQAPRHAGDATPGLGSNTAGKAYLTNAKH